MIELAVFVGIATSIAGEAGNFLGSKFGPMKLKRHLSGTHYGITEDIECDLVYRKYLAKKTPQIPIFSEENYEHIGDGWMWMVDAVEGTSNYAAGNPFFATQLCLMHDLQPVVSVVFAPKLDELFVAIHGKGATLNGRKISMSKNTELSNAIFGIGKGTKRYDLIWWGETAAQLLKNVRSVRQFGACGLEMAYSACGRLDFYLNRGSKLYDYAAGVLLCREAGGDVLNNRGKDWSSSDDFLLTGNPILSKKVFSLLEKVK